MDETLGAGGGTPGGTPGPEEYRQWLLENFGETADPYQAAFLTHRGEWISPANPLAANPMRDHAGIAERALRALNAHDPTFPGLNLYQFLLGSGAVRVALHPGDLNWEVGGPLSPEQVSALQGVVQGDQERTGRLPAQHWKLNYPLTPDLDPDLQDEFYEGASGQGYEPFLRHPLVQDYRTRYENWRASQPADQFAPKPAAAPQMSPAPKAPTPPRPAGPVGPASGGDFLRERWHETTQGRRGWLGTTKSLWITTPETKDAAREVARQARAERHSSVASARKSVGGCLVVDRDDLGVLPQDLLKAVTAPLGFSLDPGAPQDVTSPTARREAYLRLRKSQWDHWIGVDLDGTLAESPEGDFDPEVIGKPVRAMVRRVRSWLEAGEEVRILTARAHDPEAVRAVEAWCQEHLGVKLPVTNEKDPGMLFLCDDRAVAVEENTGKILGGKLRKGMESHWMLKAQGDDTLRALAHAYHQAHAQQLGIDPWDGSPLPYELNEPELQREAAGYYDQAPSHQMTPDLEQSYRALKEQTKAQWDWLTSQGYQLQPWGDQDPYRTSQEMMDDVRTNRHLGFYQGGEMPDTHPLKEAVPDLPGMTYNDVFRAVHDLYGHAVEGYQFGPRGEYNATLAHAKLYSPQAHAALVNETHGQNSWVNYGPHSHLPVTERPFAEQKVFELPRNYWPKPLRPQEPPLSGPKDFGGNAPNPGAGPDFGLKTPKDSLPGLGKALENPRAVERNAGRDTRYARAVELGNLAPDAPRPALYQHEPEDVHYHGTRQQFDQFTLQPPFRNTTGADRQLGIHLASDPGTASAITGQYRNARQGGAPRVIHAQVNAEQPVEYAQEGDLWRAMLELGLRGGDFGLADLQDFYRRGTAKILGSRASGETPREEDLLGWENHRTLVGMPGGPRQKMVNRYLRWLEGQGDVIRYGNELEGYGDRSLIVPRPEQIEIVGEQPVLPEGGLGEFSPRLKSVGLQLLRRMDEWVAERSQPAPLAKGGFFLDRKGSVIPLGEDEHHPDYIGQDLGVNGDLLHDRDIEAWQRERGLVRGRLWQDDGYGPRQVSYQIPMANRALFQAAQQHYRQFHQPEGHRPVVSVLHRGQWHDLEFRDPRAAPSTLIPGVDDDWHDAFQHGQEISGFGKSLAKGLYQGFWVRDDGSHVDNGNLDHWYTALRHGFEPGEPGPGQRGVAGWREAEAIRLAQHAGWVRGAQWRNGELGYEVELPEGTHPGPVLQRVRQHAQSHFPGARSAVTVYAGGKQVTFQPQGDDWHAEYQEARRLSPFGKSVVFGFRKSWESVDTKAYDAWMLDPQGTAHGVQGFHDDWIRHNLPQQWVPHLGRAMHPAGWAKVRHQPSQAEHQRGVIGYEFYPDPDDPDHDALWNRVEQHARQFPDHEVELVLRGMEDGPHYLTLPQARGLRRGYQRWLKQTPSDLRKSLWKASGREFSLGGNTGFHGTAEKWVPRILEQGLRPHQETGIKNFGRNGDMTDLTAKQRGVYYTSDPGRAAQIAVQAAKKRKTPASIIVGRVDPTQALPDEDYPTYLHNNLGWLDVPKEQWGDANAIRQAARSHPQIAGGYADIPRALEGMTDEQVVQAYGIARPLRVMEQTQRGRYNLDDWMQRYHAGEAQMAELLSGQGTWNHFGSAAFPAVGPGNVLAAVSFPTVNREKHDAMVQRVDPLAVALDEFKHDPERASALVQEALPGVTVQPGQGFGKSLRAGEEGEVGYWIVMEEEPVRKSFGFLRKSYGDPDEERDVPVPVGEPQGDTEDGSLDKALPERAVLPEHPGTGLQSTVRQYLAQNPHATSEELTALRDQHVPNTSAQKNHPVLGLDDWRHLVQAGLPYKDWYHEFADEMSRHVGEHNVREFAALMGPTSAQAPPTVNLRSTLRAMRAARGLEDAGIPFEGPAQAPWLLDGKGNLVSEDGRTKFKPNRETGGWLHATAVDSTNKAGAKKTEWSKWSPAPEGTGPVPNPDVNPHYAEFWNRIHPFGAQAEQSPANQFNEPVVQKLWEIYSQGRANVPSTPKTSSYYGNFVSAKDRRWDPFSTIDTWASKPAGMARTQGEKDEGPTNRWYGKAPIDDDRQNEWVMGFYDHLASEFGIAPHQAQAAVWMATKTIGDLVGRDDPALYGETVEALLNTAREKGYFDRTLSGSPFEALEDDYNRQYLAEHGDLLRRPAPGLAGEAVLEHAHGGLKPTKKDPTRLAEVGKPVTPEIREQLRQEALAASPSLVLPTAQPGLLGEVLGRHEQTLQALGYDPAQGRIPLLADLYLDHQVGETVLASPDGKHAVPHVDVKVAGGNRNTLRYLGALLGSTAGLPEIRLHAPDFGEQSYGGIAVNLPGTTPEQRFQISTRLEILGVTAEVVGEGLRLADYDGEGQAHHDRVLQALTEAGLDPAQMEVYNGYAERFGADAYEQILGEHAATFSPAGSLDLSQQRARPYADALGAAGAGGDVPGGAPGAPAGSPYGKSFGFRRG